MNRHWIYGVMGVGLAVALQGCTGLSSGVSQDDLTHDNLRAVITQSTGEAAALRLKADRMQHMAEMYEAIVSTSSDAGEVERLTARVTRIKELAQGYGKSAEKADQKAAEHRWMLFGVSSYHEKSAEVTVVEEKVADHRRVLFGVSDYDHFLN